MMNELRAARRAVSWSVGINMAIVLAGLATGGEVFIRLTGLLRADALAARLTDVGAAVAGGITMMELAMLGILPSLGLSIAGTVYMCGASISQPMRRNGIISLLLFCLAIAMVFIVGLIGAGNLPDVCRALRMLAMGLMVVSHIVFLTVLESAADAVQGYFSQRLGRSSLALLVAFALLVLVSVYGSLPLSFVMQLVLLAGFYLAWCICYLLLLREVCD